MALTDKRSYNNADLSPVNVAALKKKSKRVSQVQVKVGSKKVELPVEAFLLTTESGHGFLSIQPINAVIQVKADNSYESVLPKNSGEAVAALKAYRVRRASAEKPAPVQMPDELRKMLDSIPKGYKLILKEHGYKLVKTRSRK